MARCEGKEVGKGLTGDEKERAMRANAIYCRACEESGIKVCSWETMPGWQEFVNGEISESQLSEKAGQELNQFASVFSKYTIPTPETGRDEEDDRRSRARTANKVYKKACTDSGKNLCFFQNFTAWSDFVNGTIDEADLYVASIEEIGKMAEESR